jgi:hypothetical protein
MSFNYQAFLEDEGVPPYFQGGSPSGLFDSLREGSLRLAGIAETVSWQDFLLGTPGLRDLPCFVESELAVVYDQAMCSFGHRRQGLVLRNETLHSMFQPSSLRQGLAPQMLELAGWWSVYFPWDHKALLRYQPAESCSNRSQRGLLGYSWKQEPLTPYDRYVALREIRQACYRCGYRGWATRYMMLCYGAALNNRARDFWTTRSSGCYWNVVWGLPWIQIGHH